MKTFYIPLTRAEPEAERLFAEDLQVALGTYTLDTMEAAVAPKDGGFQRVRQVLKVTVEATSVDN